MLVHPLLRRFVVMSGGHCTYPTGGPAIRLKNKKTDEAQKAETVLSAVIYIYTPVFKNVANSKHVYNIHNYAFSAPVSSVFFVKNKNCK